MAPHSSTLAWKIPWMEEPGRLQSMGSLGVWHDWATHFHFSLSCTGEGNGNPLQCSCLENPRDGGAWWATVSGVAQSWTQLKRLSSSSSRITRKDRETGKERESTLFSKESANTPISHLNHPTHIKTLEIMRMRFKIPLLRHFFKLGWKSHYK